MATGAPAPTTAAVGGDLLQAVLDAKHGDPLAPVTVLAPTAYAAVAARRGLARSARRAAVAGVANVSCTTLGLVCRRLAASRLAQAGLRTAGSSVEVETVRAVASEGPESWARLASHPGTLAALQHAFAELRRLSPAALEALARRTARGAEVAALLVAVRARLRERGFADVLDVREVAVAVLRDGAALAAELGTVVVMDGVGDGPADDALLSALAERSDYRELPPAPAATATECWACSEPAEEARAAVRSVLAGAEAGVPLWRQALLHPGGPGYALLLRQELAAAGVPACGPERPPLGGTGAGRALLGLLELAGGDWQRQHVMAWLASAPLRTGPDGRPVPVSRWNAASAEAGVVRGLAQWRTRLDRLGDREPAWRDEASALADFVEGVAGSVPTGRRRWATWCAWAARQLEHYVHTGDDVEWPEEQRSGLAQVGEVTRSLEELDVVTGEVELSGFRRALRAELDRHRLDVSGTGGGGVGDGVFVGSFDRARGMSFHSVFLVGMADGAVPGRAADDALLPDELRALDSSGALRTRIRRQEQMRADVARALASGTERRTVCYPMVDPRTGRVQAPSRFLSEMAPAALPVRRVESLAASLRGGGPSLSMSEHLLRALDAWADTGLDPADSPPARLDPRLRTGLRAARWRRGDRFTRFDGFVGAGQVTPFDPAHPVSATRLELYAQCPRKFLFERVLGIRERTLPEELWRIEARDRGSLVHAVLEQYVAERVEGARRSLERLLEIAEAHLDEATAGGMVGKALLWRLERAAIVRDLHVFFAEEAGLEPVAAELAFGDDGDDAAPPLTVTLPDGRHLGFRGRIDRVDRGSEDELLVSDYKTGRQAGIAELREDPLEKGKRLQLPLYAMAARQATGWNGPVVGRYWMVSGNRVAAQYRLELTEPVERHFNEVVARIARGIDTGCFPGIPGDPRDGGFAGCTWCDFDVVCPADRDRQWAAKRSRPELAPVADLLDVEVPEPLPGFVVKAGTAERPSRPVSKGSP